MKDIRLQIRSTYNGHTVKKSGVISLKLVASYSELVKVIPVLQLLNNTTALGIRVEGKVHTLGSFMLHTLRIDSDGVSSIQFNSIIDDVNLTNLNILSMLDREEEIEVLIKGTVELEEEDD